MSVCVSVCARARSWTPILKRSLMGIVEVKEAPWSGALPVESY